MYGKGEFTADRIRVAAVKGAVTLIVAAFVLAACSSEPMTTNTHTPPVLTPPPTSAPTQPAPTPRNESGVAAPPTSVFDGLSSLTALYLDNNRLTALPEGVFDGLPVLTTLSLSNNRLTALPKGIFDGLPSLTELDLRGNPMLDADHLAGLASRVNLWLDERLLESLQLTPTPSPVLVPTP